MNEINTMNKTIYRLHVRLCLLRFQLG